MSKADKDKIGFWEAASIGVGGMVGGGIFAVLGLFALASLLWQTAHTSPQRIWILVVMAGTAFFIEAAFRLFTQRKIRLPK